MTSPYALRASCRGHEDDVRGVAICAPDVFATCSRDKTVRVWAEAIGEDDGFVTRAVCVGHTSFVTTVASIPPNVLQSLPDGGLVSGGRDKRVLVWNTHTGLAVHDFIGHALDVTAVAVLATGHIVSGAMDKTIKVWCAVTQKCVTTIDAHESSVLALLPLPGGGFLSGSADRTIKKWTDQWWGGPDQKPTAGTDSSRNQSPAATYRGHVDTVRGLALAPGVGFLSASHDCTARLWTFGGETVLVFAGHAALVYAVAAMANGKVLTGSEDNTCKIWTVGDGVCQQTIPHPGCVWSVGAFISEHSCSDIVTCCADGIARVWSDVVTKQNGNAQAELDETLLKQATAKREAALADQQSKIKTEPPSALLTPGASDGATKVIKEDAGGVAAYAWSAAAQSWERLGEVTGVDPDSVSKKQYQGQEYDYVFDVDITDGAPALKLPFNVGDNPYTAAELFLENNQLDPGYREQVVNFIVQNVGEQNAFSGSGACVSADPFTGAGAYVPGGNGSLNSGPFAATGGDPFTGSGAYVPGSVSAATTKPETTKMKFIPVLPTQCVFFETAKFEGMLAKLAELGCSASEMTAFTVLATFANGGEAPDTGSVQVLTKALVEKPTESLFPLLDLSKALVVLIDRLAGSSTCGGDTVNELVTAMMHACARASQPPASPGNLLTAGRLFCNAFKCAGSRKIFLLNASAILDGLCAATLSDAKPATRLALSTSLLNVSAFAKSDDCLPINDVAAQAVSAGVELLLTSPPGSGDDDAKFRALCALGTFAVASSDTKALLVDLGLGDIAEGMEGLGGKIGDAAGDVKTALM